MVPNHAATRQTPRRLRDGAKTCPQRSSEHRKPRRFLRFPRPLATTAALGTNAVVQIFKMSVEPHVVEVEVGLVPTRCHSC